MTDPAKLKLHVLFFPDCDFHQPVAVLTRNWSKWLGMQRDSLSQADWGNELLRDGENQTQGPADKLWKEHKHGR